MKKLISMLLVLCMVLGMSVSVFAEGPIGYAQIGDTVYLTLGDAIASVETGEEVTIEVLGNHSGPGAVLKSGSNITIDFDGCTYTFTEPAVGSSGTESNGFQLLKNSNVIMKNGTLNVSADHAEKYYILIQNYCNLTLENMTLDGTYLDKYSTTDGDSYVLSNNSGNVTLAGSTSITANDQGELAWAFDVCKKSNYTVPTVTVDTTGTIKGNIEVSEGLEDNLIIQGGTFTAEVIKYLAEGLTQDETGKVVESSTEGEEDDTTEGGNDDATGTPSDTIISGGTTTDDSWYEEEIEEEDNHTSSSDMDELIEETSKNDTDITIDDVNEETTISKKAMEKAIEEDLDIEFKGDGYVLTLKTEDADFSDFKGTFNPYIDIDAGCTTSMKSELKENGIDAADVQVIKTKYSGKLPGEMELEITLDKELRGEKTYFYYWNPELKQYELIPHTVKGNKIIVKLSHFSTYIVTNEPIEGAVIAEQGVNIVGSTTVVVDKANPETGASDFVGAAVALAVVSSIGVVALNKRR